MYEDLNTIDPLHPEILKAYRGRIVGTHAPTDSYGEVTDIEFDTVRNATGWAQTCEVEARVMFRDEMRARNLTCTCVIQLYPDDIFTMDNTVTS